MAKTHQTQHTVLPRAHLQDYFDGPRFEMFDIVEERWISTGPNSFGVWNDYNDDEYEKMLSKVESAAIPLVRKLGAGQKLDDQNRFPWPNTSSKLFFGVPSPKTRRYRKPRKK